MSVLFDSSPTCGATPRTDPVRTAIVKHLTDEYIGLLRLGSCVVCIPDFLMGNLNMFEGISGSCTTY